MTHELEPLAFAAEFLKSLKTHVKEPFPMHFTETNEANLTEEILKILTKSAWTPSEMLCLSALLYIRAMVSLQKDEKSYTPELPGKKRT
jgi:hypothetical protein